jgi:alpha-L-rhamnosidase
VAMGLTSAHAIHDSPYGRIESSWRIAASEFVLDVRIPPGTTAEVRLPDGERVDATTGAVTYRCRAGGWLGPADSPRRVHNGK